MADASELKRIQETLDYFNRYYEFDSAIKVLRENRQYLETYIRTKHYVEDKYDAYGKTRKSMVAALIVAAVAALIVLLISGITSLETVNIIVAVAVAAVCWCGVFFLCKTLIAKNVDKKWQEQQKVNDDIAVQIEEVTKRCESLEAQRNGYLDALDEKGLIVIPSKYIIEAEKIASYVKEDKAKTAEEAVKMFEEEQNRLKERALAERKRREEEAAAAKALNIERERQRAIREQREAELRKVAEEERQRANVTPPSEIALSREQPEEAAASASAPQSKGLSLAMGASSKKNTRKPEPAVKEEAPAEKTQSEPRSGGLSLASGAKPSGASVRPQEARPHRTVESVMMGGEMADISAQPSGNGLALASGNKKRKPQRTAPMQQEKLHQKYEPIRLVDEPDDTPQAVDEETLDLEARMQSLLSANKPVLKRRSPMSQEQRDSIEKRISSQLEPEQPMLMEEEAPMPIEQPLTQTDESVAEEAAEQIPFEPAEPEPIEPAAPTEPEIPEEPSEQEAPPEQPKNPFSGLAMKKK